MPGLRLMPKVRLCRTVFARFECEQNMRLPFNRVQTPRDAVAVVFGTAAAKPPSVAKRVDYLTADHVDEPTRVAVAAL